MEEKIICDADTKKDIMKALSINIIKVKYDRKSLRQNNPYYEQYKTAHNHNKKIHAENRRIFQDWYVRFTKYSMKMTTLFNIEESRQQIQKYIEYHDSSNPVIKLIQTGYSLVDIKQDDNTPSLISDRKKPYYWICEWKEEMANKVLEEKPVFDTSKLNYGYMPPEIILSRVSLMMPQWLLHNDINLFVIKIVLKRINKDVPNIGYINSNGKETYCYRTMTELGPCCEPCEPCNCSDGNPRNLNEPKVQNEE